MKIIKSTLSLLLCLSIFTSCSYIETESAIKEKLTPAEEKTESQEEIADSNFNEKVEEAIEHRIPLGADEEQVHSIGNKFSLMWGEETEQYEITVNNVDFFDSMDDIGGSIADTRIDRESMERYYYDLGSNSFIDGRKLVVADITIKNKSVPALDDEHNIGIVSIRDFGYKICEDAVYFSDHPEQVTSSNYYHYILPIGESKTVKVGWVINMNDYKAEDLYLIFGMGTEDRLKQYVYVAE